MTVRVNRTGNNIKNSLFSIPLRTHTIRTSSKLWNILLLDLFTCIFERNYIYLICYNSVFKSWGLSPYKMMMNRNDEKYFQIGFRDKALIIYVENSNIFKIIFSEFSQLFSKKCLFYIYFKNYRWIRLRNINKIHFIHIILKKIQSLEKFSINTFFLYWPLERRRLPLNDYRDRWFLRWFYNYSVNLTI